MPTPAQIGDKFDREWQAAKPIAKANYASVASQIPDRLIAAKDNMIARYTAAINGGKLERGIAPYRNNDRLSNLYSQGLDAITAITAEKKAKVARDVALKRTLASHIPAIITTLKAASSGELTVPTGLADDALAPIIVQAINANQASLSTTSTAAQILTAIGSTLTTLGFPNKA